MSDHAPTLDEQLPPLRPQAFRYSDDFEVWKKREAILTSQRDAALRDNREKDRQYTLCCEARLDALKGFHEQLAEKDARIAELEAKITRREQWLKEHSEKLDAAEHNAESAEAKLRAVAVAYARYPREGRVDNLLASIGRAIQ